jgi:cell division protein FtsI/penicillin-binding protein 2
MGSVQPGRRGRRPGGRTALAAIAALTIGILLPACSSGPTAREVAASFLRDWSAHDCTGMRSLAASPPADFTTANKTAYADLGASSVALTAGPLVTAGSSAAHEAITARYRLPGVGVVPIASTLRLVKSGAGWQVAWAPATIAPQLKAGGRLAVQVTWPPRAQILGAGGAPLTSQVPMVTIGVEGQRIRQRSVVRSVLLAAGAPRRAVDTALAGATSQPTWFEPVFTVSWRRYLQLKPSVYPVPGTVFETVHERAPLTPGLGYVVGSVGPVTAEELQQLGPPYSAASIVGQTGLERADQKQLAGQPGVTVTAVSAAGATVGTVATLPPRAGAPVTTSIDPAVQRAAEAALASVRKNAALVAVDARTGQVLASVSVPAGGGFDLALDGSYPPGSSFKVLTSTALIEHGLRPSSPASCPTTITVDGEVFHNAEGTAPVTDLLHAFAESCNTAFIGLATRHLTGAELTATARLYRIGQAPQLGLPAFAGSVPAPGDQADLAADVIGQGQVLVSPLNMAMVAAAVDTGEIRAPQLVTAAASAPAAPASLPSAVVRSLHTMMAQVTLTGTASGQGLPAGTYAKTGTAQYGHGNPLPTDAWLIGFHGSLAFAMITVDGGEGGPTDGPVVATFLKKVDSLFR